MGTTKWNVTREIEQAHEAQVFSGGACNILDADGNLLRNGERDKINDWLTEKDIILFDPQIHPDTHGEEYIFEKHSVIEVEARKAATLNLYEISPRTFGGITSLEIAADHFRYNEPMVLYYSDGSTTEDRIPQHDKFGSPIFVPYGVPENEAACLAHYKEMRKNANNMRKYLMRLARDLPNLTVSFSKASTERDVVIMPDRMHAADIFEAVVRALKDERVFVHFPSDITAQDRNGNPTFTCPEKPAEYELHAWLDQYVDAANALRRRIADLVSVNVYVRVVYTQVAAIEALSELIALGKIEPAD